MPWTSLKARAVVSNSSVQGRMHELGRSLPVGRGHGVPSGSLVPLQSVCLMVPVRPQNLGHVPGPLGVAPQIVAGLQQIQAPRCNAFQHQARDILLGNLSPFSGADAGMQPMWKLLLQLGECFSPLRGDGQGGCACRTTVVRNGGQKSGIHGCGEQGRFSPSGMANGAHLRHSGMSDLQQNIQAPLQAPRPNGQSTSRCVWPVFKSRAFAQGGVVVKGQFGSVEPSQGGALTQDGRDRFVAQNMRPATIGTKQHRASAGAHRPNDGEAPADPSGCTNAHSPNLQFAVALQQAVSALRLDSRVFWQEAPKQGLESCEVRRRMRRRRG